MVAVGEVFAAIDVMAARDRVELCRLLRRPAGRFPLVPDEIADLQVPGDRGRQEQLLVLVDRTVRHELEPQLADRTLAAVVPALRRLPGGVDTAAGTTNRLVASVSARSSTRWSTLGGHRIADVRAWRGMGSTTVTQLIGLAVRAALGHLAPATDPLAQQALFDERRNALTTALDRVLEEIDDDRARAIFEQIDLRLDAPTLTSARAPGRDSTTARLTAPVVAGLVGLSYERVRQLRARAHAQVRAAARREPDVAHVVARLATHLGSAVRSVDLATAVVELGLAPIDDPATLLAMWLAGPYLPVAGRPGWRSPAPDELVGGTRTVLSGAGGVHDHRSVLDDLARIGVAAHAVDGWLAAQPVCVGVGLVVHLAGRPVVIAERILEASGRATTSAELQRWMTDTSSAGSLTVALRRSSRFVETAPDLWELAEWGGQPSDHVVRLACDVTEAVLAACVGRAPDRLATLLALQPGKPRRFPTRFGPLTITYDGEHVGHGSIRPIVLACGAPIGATIVFTIDPRTETAAVEVRAGAGQPPPGVSV